jgi:hypothetical protein
MDQGLFKLSIVSSEPPSGIEDHLLALWYDAKGDWEGAHRTIQDIPGPLASWIHAYLHRKEGDDGNAGYWYSKAGRKMSAESLDKEQELILGELLDH